MYICIYMYINMYIYIINLAFFRIYMYNIYRKDLFLNLLRNFCQCKMEKCKNML